MRTDLTNALMVIFTFGLLLIALLTFIVHITK